VLEDAIEHLTAIAARHQPAELFLHRLDHKVQRIAAISSSA
jgi:hypothetical protein